MTFPRYFSIFKHNNIPVIEAAITVKQGDEMKKINTPPLGWNSWDCFGAGVNERQLRENAEFMAKELKPFGWQYIVCDIQWYEPEAKDNNYNNFYPLNMDEYGRLMPAENRFPSAKGGKGFEEIAAYCHSLGLKFGIHIMRGVPREAVHRNLPIKGSKHTCREIAHHFSVCPWNTDMYGLKDTEGAQEYYNSIFELYARWGVDYIKCDDIAVTEFSKETNPYSAAHEVEMISKAIKDSGREMVLSLSPGPAGTENAPHMRKYADMWRISGDFWDEWGKLKQMFKYCEEWQNEPFGAWPDCDMLPLGTLSKNGTCHGAQNRKTNFTRDEQLTMLNLWGIFKSPLMYGGNLPECDEWDLALITNEEYLKMHSETTLRHEIYKDGGIIAWLADAPHAKYFAAFNLNDEEKGVALDLGEYLNPGKTYLAHDIWAGTLSRFSDYYDDGDQSKPEFTFQNGLKTQLRPHASKVFRVDE